MKLLLLTAAMLAHAQTFDVASIRRVPQPVGPDYNNKIAYTDTGFSARDVTLARLIAEAYRLQLSQISGPKWITSNEYEIEARAAVRPTPAMLQSLLAERFQLKQHAGTKTISAHELSIDRSGFKVPSAKTGYHFHGDMRQLADLIGVQLTIPEGHDPTRPTIGSPVPVLVMDRTGLTDSYDFFLPLGPGIDLPSLLREQLGLRLDNRKAQVEVLLVDSALQIPTDN